MYFPTAALLAVCAACTGVLAAPVDSGVLTTRASGVSASDFVSTMSNSVDTMRSSVSGSLKSMNSTAQSNTGFGEAGAMVHTFLSVVDAYKTYKNDIEPLVSNPLTNFTIEEIETLTTVLGVYKDIFSEVEQTVDAVVDAFFPGFLDFFRPFIQLWINVFDSFTAPFIQFYVNLVGSLSGSPELAKAINDYITEIQDIENDFLNAF